MRDCFSCSSTGKKHVFEIDLRLSRTGHACNPSYEGYGVRRVMVQSPPRQKRDAIN
jgi:hypothetical protein